MTAKTLLNITVSPKSSRSDILIDKSGNIKIYLNSPPVDGKANNECIALLAKKLKIAKSNITIEKGEHRKNKTVSVNGMNIDTIMKKLRDESNE